MGSAFPHLILDGLSIVLIDLLLAGDNALVIAMAVRSLPPRERRLGILGGSAAAVLLRVVLTIVAAQLLNIEFLKLIGGAFVLYIAVKVISDASEPPDEVAKPGSLLKAIWFIVFADITMSVDNVLAIAGASKGHVGLIIFGLGLSIPLVVFSSNLLSKIMDRYPVIIYLGAAILGRVGAEMMLTDPYIVRTMHPSTTVDFAVQAAVILAVLVAGKLLGRSRRQV